MMKVRLLIRCRKARNSKTTGHIDAKTLAFADDGASSPQKDAERKEQKPQMDSMQERERK